MDGTERALLLPLMRAKHALVSEQPENVTASAVSTDEELLGRIQKHDESSALTLFHRYDKLAFSVGLRILQDEAKQKIWFRRYSYASVVRRTHLIAKKVPHGRGLSR
jgi:hypothetical protein